MDVQRAISFIERNGDRIERARIESVVCGEPPSAEVFKQLGKLQKPDGSFAYWCPQVSNLCDTAYVLRWIDELGCFRHGMAARACEFLLDRQQADGGWDEVEEVGRYSPSEWMIPGRIATRTWLTGFCAHVLIRSGRAEAPGTRCPTDSLLSQCDETRRIEGYLRATWISLPMLALHPGPRSEANCNGLTVVEESYSDDWAGAQIAWLLRCLKDADVPLEHRLAGRAIADLESKQRSDGSWEPEPGEGEGLAVNATVSALGSLHAYAQIEL